MDANYPERGGGITERAHIKLLRTLTSEGPDLQKGLASLAANPLLAEPWAPFTRSLSQGDFDSFEKDHEGNGGQRIMQISLSWFLLITSRELRVQCIPLYIHINFTS